MKDQIVEAVTERIKTPFLGYAVLAFVVLNREALFLFGTNYWRGLNQIDLL